MEVVLTIPDAATMRVGKEKYHSLPAGTVLERMHDGQFAATQFNGTIYGNARFSPIRDAGSAIIPTIYGGQTFDVAVCEIILRCSDTPTPDPRTGLPPLEIVSPASFAHYAHSIVTTNVALNLVDLTIMGQRRIGVSGNALLAGPRSTYPGTRSWAERIHATCPDAQGIYYTSYQAGPGFAVVLFGDRLPPAPLTAVSTQAVADATCHDRIVAIARSLSIEYQDI